MQSQTPTPLTFDEQDALLIEQTLHHMLRRHQRGFTNAEAHPLPAQLNRAEAFAIATAASLAYQHLKGAYNDDPNAPPIHLTVAPDIDARYRAAVEAARGEEHRRMRAYLPKLLGWLGVSLALNLLLLSLIPALFAF
jgi:hypothetical protein